MKFFDQITVKRCPKSVIFVKIQGGLGNQLFQYAAARSLSLKFETELRVDISFYEKPIYKDVHYRLDRFNLPFTIASEDDFIHLLNRMPKSFINNLFKKFLVKINPFHKKTHLFENEIMNLSKSRQKIKIDYYIEGWFGSSNYFKDYREIFIKEFNLDNLLSKKNKTLKYQMRNSNSIAVHIRRGDYLTNLYFKNLPKEYYLCAIKRSRNEVDNPIFYFFSDDIAWTKEQFSYIDNARFIDNKTISDAFGDTPGDISDLMLMRSCKNQIIANSTFSWWGAWLNENPNKRVYYPAYWYNNSKAQMQFEENSFIPSDWIKIQF